MSIDDTQEDTDKQRKRMIFRSWHRGTREMDLILGSFADKYIPGFSEEELSLYDEVLLHSDPDLYNWVTGKESVPANYVNSVMEKLVEHSL